MRELRCTACQDLYVVAVLTSTAALGSITANGDGKGGALTATCKMTILL